MLGNNVKLTNISMFNVNQSIHIFSRIEAYDQTASESLHGERYTSYGRVLSFSMSANFKLDVSGVTLVTIEGPNGMTHVLLL